MREVWSNLIIEASTHPMSAPIQIREFVTATNANELRRLLPAFLDIWNAPENLPCLSASLRPFEESVVRRWFQDHLSAGVRYFAAVDDSDRILGISVIRTEATRGFELFGIGVRPEAQRSGVGRQMISCAFDLAASLGFMCVETSVFADNVRMLRLTLSLGFLPVHIDHHRRADGADIVVLHRRTSAQSLRDIDARKQERRFPGPGT